MTTVLSGALRGMRPRQWIKNVLVLAAPLAAGQIQHGHVLGRALLAMLCFCLVSSAVYLVNDVRDVEEDRRHPVKSSRPIASGDLPIPVALVLAAVVAVVGLGVGFLVAWQLGVTLAVYLLVQAAYSMGLKHQPVLDLAVVASGFLLRAIAGGTATGIVLSQWFLLVASFGSLFMVAGKRYSEIRSLGADAGTRRSLEYYSESYLRFVWSLAASATVVFYSLWAFTQPQHGFRWAAISIAPLTLGVLRYAVDVDRGDAGSPEDIVLGDRVLQAIGVVLVVLVALAVFGVGDA